MPDEEARPFLPAKSNRDLDGLRSAPTGLCWWCGINPATTREHKHKATDLRHLANAGGVVQPKNLYRGGPGFSGYLRSLARGSAVQWGKVMCKACNGGRDRPFDEAYAIFADHVRTHEAELRRSRSMSWRSVYGSDWRQSATNLARYYGKQLGCCLSTQCLPVPDSLRAFLDGEARPAELGFELNRSRVHAAFYDRGARERFETCGLWLKPAMVHMTRDGEDLIGADHAYGLGFVTATARWRAGGRRMLCFFAQRTAPLPMIDEPGSPPLA